MSVHFTLSAEQRSDLERLVRLSGVPDRRTVFRDLAQRVEASASAWAAAHAARIGLEDQTRLSHLVRLLTSAHSPGIGLIRARVAALPLGIVRVIEGRARQLSLQVEAFSPLGTDLKSWAKSAKPNDLVTLLSGCLIQGGQWMAGRNRPNSKQSAPRLMPIIAARSNTLKNNDGFAGGRPSRDDLRLLISFLAVDWLQSTGLQPDKGRSDETPFGALVFMVFCWIGEADKAAHSLRTYWYPPKPRPKTTQSAALSLG